MSTQSSPDRSRHRRTLVTGAGPKSQRFERSFSAHQRRAHPLAISGVGFQLARMKREVLAHLQLHSIDLCQEPACREVVVCRIRLYLAQIGDLALKVTNPLKARIELLVVGNHDASEMISTMPRRRPSRFTCQNSTAACSSCHAARWRTQNTLAPKCAGAAP